MPEIIYFQDSVNCVCLLVWPIYPTIFEIKLKILAHYLPFFNFTL